MTTKAELQALADTIEQLQADKRELMEALEATIKYIGPNDPWYKLKDARAILAKITAQHAK